MRRLQGPSGLPCGLILGGLSRNRKYKIKEVMIMTEKRELDECLEFLWKMKEGKQDSVESLRECMKTEFNKNHLTELADQGLIEFKEGEKKIGLTEKGASVASLIVRSHRLAERLIHNVMGMHYESGACEFEHIITAELVDSICTLLGHPRECPHGLSIPEGECCKRAANTAFSLVVPLTQLQVGEQGQIAYINCANDQRLHMLEGLRIRPGTNIRLEQVFPVCVISCEGGSIAIDEKIVQGICVWRPATEGLAAKVNDNSDSPSGKGEAKQKKFRFGWGKKDGKPSNSVKKDISEIRF